MFDPANRVVALCAEGMAREGEPGVALRLFEEAWAARTDDFEAAIAAHYVARHQPTAEEALRWNSSPCSTPSRCRTAVHRGCSRRSI
jgi:hypothetical protein